MRKPAFSICENKGIDQLRGYRATNQHLCFRYLDSIIPLLSKSKISGLEQFSVIVHPSLCQTCLETQKTGFLTMQLIYIYEPLCDKSNDFGYVPRKDSE